MASEDAFDLSKLNTIQRGQILRAIRRCEFDFTLCLPRLKAEQNRDKIPVTYEDLSRFNNQQVRNKNTHTHSTSDSHHDGFHTIEFRNRVMGLAYYSGAVVIELSLIGHPDLAQEVFLAEGAHMVDFFVTTPEQRANLFDVFHGSNPTDGPDTGQHDHGWFEETGNNDYWSWVGESWMSGFILAYSDVVASFTGFVHLVDEEKAQELRRVLDGTLVELPQPEPEVEVEPEIVVEPEPEHKQFYATKKGKVFHDNHKGVKEERIFHSYQEAVDAGLKPCNTCDPWL